MSIHSIILKLSTLFYKAAHPSITIGDNAIIYPNTYVSTKWGGVIYIGSRSRIGVFQTGYKIGRFYSTRLTARGTDSCIVIGEESNLNGVNIFARKSVIIGKNAEIASGVIITDLNGHPTYSTNRTKGEDTPSPVVIGNNVWIGLNSIILKGTEIGDNCIVSAGSVVKGIFPPNSIITGNPAKVVKQLIYDKNEILSTDVGISE